MVASMRPVPDAIAAKLMESFHANLQQTGDPAGALRPASLTARESWSDPSRWAAFSLYGL